MQVAPLITMRQACLNHVLFKRSLMKLNNPHKRTVLFVTILVCSVFCIDCKRSPDVTLHPEDFMNPPSSSAVHTWWHWMDNNITREGITKDLEAMKSQGITTATLFNIGNPGEHDFGIPHVIFNTDEWYEMFEWTLEEADRLGMTIGAHNTDGWSSSGGPWITPETSMKRTVWSKSFIRGGKSIDQKLPKPHGNHNYYEDIRVLAIPARAEPSSFQHAKPAIKAGGSSTGNLLYDGNPFSMIDVEDGSYLEILFENDFTAEMIAIHPRVEYSWANLQNIRFRIELKVSSDGIHYRTIKVFDDPAVNRTSIIDIPNSTGKFFRLDFTNIIGLAEPQIGIAEIELLKKNESPAYNTDIPFHLEKTSTTMANNEANMFMPGKDASAVPFDDVIDVTEFMTLEGILKWDAPAGNWNVLRLGYTTTGVQNAHATIAGTGLEVDKLDTTSLNIHFNNYPKKLIEHAGEYAGNTFEFLLIDSWECRYQNWTGKFAEEFEQRRNYSIYNWLPVLAGITVESSEATERFLLDFRQTIAEMIEENYYRHFHDLTQRYGLSSYLEVIYGGRRYPPVDILKSNSIVDVPMYEFWAGPSWDTGYFNYTPVEKTNFSLPAHTAALYDKKIIAAEAYTGFANYSETPWDLKLIGDQWYTRGINRMVLHTNVHQPFEKKPGFTLDIYGQSFNRHNTWWDLSSQWFTYQHRVQYILQQGTPVADILYFMGDSYYQDLQAGSAYDIPAGYFSQNINLDALLHQSRVRNGMIELNNGLQYGLLLLPDDGYLQHGSLKRIAKLVREGAVVVGPKPSLYAGSHHSDYNTEQFNELADNLWGKAGTEGIYENQYGKGRVFSGMDLQDILDVLQLTPDFVSQHDKMANLLFFHKKIGTFDVYFVVNQEDRRVVREISFRKTGKSPEIWNPQYGTVSVPSGYQESDGYTTITTEFGPKESLFFVFRDSVLSGLPVREVPGDYYTLNDFTGSVAFEGLPDKSPIPVDEFSSWTNNNDPDIRFYSGNATYKIAFHLPEDLINRESLYLSLDEVKNVYEITLNDVYLGSSTFPGHKFDVSGLLKKQTNTLEIRVANTWRNRIIGDYTEFGELRNIWTTTRSDMVPSWSNDTVDILPGKDKPLQESGILAPVKIYYYKK